MSRIRFWGWIVSVTLTAIISAGSCLIWFTKNMATVQYVDAQDKKILEEAVLHSDGNKRETREYFEGKIQLITASQVTQLDMLREMKQDLREDRLERKASVRSR